MRWNTVTNSPHEVAAVTKLSADQARDFLRYDPATGYFHWLIAAARRNKVGGRAGTLHTYQGRRSVTVRGQKFNCGRLAWFFVHGKWPDGVIDHINGRGGERSLLGSKEEPA